GIALPLSVPEWSLLTSLWRGERNGIGGDPGVSPPRHGVSDRGVGGRIGGQCGFRGWEARIPSQDPGGSCL
ncbi:MAG: hypothetical protein QM230_06455, partial [Chloroflexota bacterium]|nr:hypothetical protein [Chloroflexota bacterium]